MNSRKFSITLTGKLIIGLTCLLPLAAQAVNLDELNDQLSRQQQQLDMMADQLENASSSGLYGAQGSNGNKLSIGGYGELHYNNLDNDGPAGNKNELDFHRFVLFIGHEFSENIQFVSELELEHALVKDTADASGPGEIELEQAYIDIAYADRHGVRAGLFLMPVGLLNETHEPPRFYGTERNPVEKNIIPSTWWEGGVAVYGELAPGWRYDAAVTSGLNVSGPGYKIRDGRQKVAKATAVHPAYTARLQWRGAAGLSLSAAVQYQDDITQGSDATAGGALLTEVDAVLSQGAMTLKALYANWALQGNGPKATGADQQQGWYIEPSYKLSPTLGLFARFNQWDNSAGDSIDSEYGQTDIGVNYWPHEDVVFKLDLQQHHGPIGTNLYDGVNIGVGYQF